MDKPSPPSDSPPTQKYPTKTFKWDKDDGLPTASDGPKIEFGHYKYGKKSSANYRKSTRPPKQKLDEAGNPVPTVGRPIGNAGRSLKLKGNSQDIEEMMTNLSEDMIDKLIGDKPGIINQDDYAQLPESAVERINQDIVDKSRALFVPNEGPQTEFLASSEREIFFGGSRGGGKSQALIVDPLRYCNHPEHSALIIRKTMPELRDLIHKAQRLYLKAFPGTKWKSQENMFVFPSGARIEFGYADTVDDLNRYQGRAFNWIGIDELPQFSFYNELMIALRGAFRTTDPVKLPLQFRATGNPGSVASDLVKKDFIAPAPPNTTFYHEVVIPSPSGPIIEKISKKFIKSTIYDNPYLLKDNSYLAMLASLPPIKRKQWLDGDWDVCEGAAFSEFDRTKHVIKPFEIPDSWPRVRGMDWGYNQSACCVWLACSPDDTLVLYREWYFNQLLAVDAAHQGRSKEFGENIRIGVLDTSAWNKRGDSGMTPGEILTRVWGKWIPSSRARVQHKNSRVAGKQQVHQALSSNPKTGKPYLVIFENCTNIISQLAGLPLDKHNNEDVDTNAEDHAYDALRYALQTRQMKLPSWFSGDLSSLGVKQQYTPVDPVFGY